MNSMSTEIAERNPLSFIHQDAWNALHRTIKMMEEYRTLRRQLGDKHPRVSALRMNIMQSKGMSETAMRRAVSEIASVILVWRLLGKFNAELMQDLVDGCLAAGDIGLANRAEQQRDAASELNQAVESVVRNVFDWFNTAMDNAEEIVRGNLDAHPYEEKSEGSEECDCPACSGSREEGTEADAIAGMLGQLLGIDPANIRAVRIG